LPDLAEKNTKKPRLYHTTQI